MEGETNSIGEDYAGKKASKSSSGYVEVRSRYLQKSSTKEGSTAANRTHTLEWSKSGGSLSKTPTGPMSTGKPQRRMSKTSHLTEKDPFGLQGKNEGGQLIQETPSSSRMTATNRAHTFDWSKSRDSLAKKSPGSLSASKSQQRMFKTTCLTEQDPFGLQSRTEDASGMDDTLSCRSLCITSPHQKPLRRMSSFNALPKTGSKSVSAAKSQSKNVKVRSPVKVTQRQGGLSTTEASLANGSTKPEKTRAIPIDGEMSLWALQNLLLQLRYCRLSFQRAQQQKSKVAEEQLYGAWMFLQNVEAELGQANHDYHKRQHTKRVHEALQQQIAPIEELSRSLDQFEGSYAKLRDAVRLQQNCVSLKHAVFDVNEVETVMKEACTRADKILATLSAGNEHNQVSKMAHSTAQLQKNANHIKTLLGEVTTMLEELEHLDTEEKSFMLSLAAFQQEF